MRQRPSRPQLVVYACALGTALALAACGGGSSPAAPPAGTPAASPVDQASAATVSGSVTLDGTPPPADVIRLDGDATCVSLNGTPERRAEGLMMGDGNAIQNVFVYVKDGLGSLTFPAPTEPVVLDQRKCQYVPHVMGVQVGQPFVIQNSDTLLHNVRADGQVNQPFNLGQPMAGIKMTRTFSTREVMVPFKCDVHAWMTAFVGVLDHPFHAVSDGAGRFSLAGLPPGTYTIEAWHEKLGTQTQQVTVGAKDTKTVSFTFKL